MAASSDWSNQTAAELDLSGRDQWHDGSWLATNISILHFLCFIFRNICYSSGMNDLFGALKPLGLLEAVAGMSRPATLAELAASVGVPKPTMHRWLASLETAGLLQRTLDGRRFELAPRSSRLAFSILGNRPGGTIRHEILQRVVQEVGEACNLTVLEGTQVTYLDRVEAEWLLRISFQQGSKVPAYCSASGKLFLALMRPANERASAGGLRPPTRCARPRCRSRCRARPCDQPATNRELWSHSTRSFPGHIRNDKFL